MAAPTIYISAGLPVSKASGVSPGAGDITAYISAGLAPEHVSGTTCTLSGTAEADNITEADVRAGAKEIILTLTDDTFIDTAGSKDGIAGGTDSDVAGANKWDAVVKVDLDNADVVLSVGDTVATITLPDYAGYDTDETETITVTIPAASLTLSGDAVVAAPTFTVDAVAAGSTLRTLNLLGVGA